MKNAKRLLSLGCTAALVVSLVGVNTGVNNKMKSAMAADLEEVEEIQETLEQLEGASGIVSHSDTTGKEETVYAILDGNGTLQQTIVSEWLKNAEGSKSLTDSSSLSDITVVKGDAEYTISGDQIVWSTDGSDVYYQGTSDKKLPVEVSVSYELDGKKVTAEELAGASGHLKLTFHYTNNEYKNMVINGQNQRIYQPFLMVSGMMLDNEKAANVTVDNGSVVNSGDETLVFGLAMPGIKDSLGLQDLDIEIPETVTVEADVTDFSLMMTLTVASNRALSQLGLDEIDTIDDLKADMNELTDGMKELVDGATKLSDGTGELKNGTDELADGASDLHSGTTDLVSGVNELSAGVSELDNGASDLKAGVGELKSKVPELSAGVAELKNGTSELKAGVKQLTDKNEALTNGAASLESGLKELDGSLKSEESKAKLNMLLQGSSEFSTGISNASDGLTQITTGYDYENENLAALIAGLKQYASGLAATGDATNMAYAGYINKLIETYEGLYDNVESAQMGVSALAAAYGTIDDGIGTVAGSISSVSEAVDALSEGAGSLNEGVTEYTEGVTAVSAGMAALDEGVTTLNEKVPVLVDGIGELSDGTDALKAGTTKLSEGTEGLTEGAGKLNDGTASLKTGVSKLLDGIEELVNGSGDLKDGAVKFDEEGIQKLADLVNGDLETYFDRIKALQDYAEEYTTYAGCAEDVECSVKFIYKTDEIKKK